MRRVLYTCLALILTGCNASYISRFNNSNQQSLQSEISNRAENLIASGHSVEKKQGQSIESPMARPIDVSEMTAEIEKAKAAYEKNPKSEELKDKLASAYFKRAFALTEAAQYRAALGDFRKGLKLKPDDKDAKAMHDRILSIFASLRREPPKEGEEPPPLPFNKP